MGVDLGFLQAKLTRRSETLVGGAHGHRGTMVDQQVGSTTYAWATIPPLALPISYMNYDNTIPKFTPEPNTLPNPKANDNPTNKPLSLMK